MPSCPFCKKRALTGDDLQEHISRKHPEEATDLTLSRVNQRKKFQRKRNQKPPIVVDGNNVAYYNGEPAIANNIKKARAFLLKNGYYPIIYVSAALRHNIDDTLELVRMINLDWIREVESGENDDEMLIEEAFRKKSQIVSNDNFDEFQKTFNTKNWQLKNSIINFEFVDGKFQLVK